MEKATRPVETLLLAQLLPDIQPGLFSVIVKTFFFSSRVTLICRIIWTLKLLPYFIPSQHPNEREPLNVLE